MRRLVAFSLVIALVGCSGDDSQPDPSTTTSEATTSTTAEFAASKTVPVPSSTSTPTEDERAGGESIGVTEKITITITDAED